MVRDGLTNITKLEFLSYIGRVRLQAFKASTILSAFRKTGISPFNPQPVLQILEDREARARTPTPPPRTHSSPFGTPITYRQIHKVAGKLQHVLREDEDLDPKLSQDLGRFIKGSLSLVSELIQTKRDLGKTRLAERLVKQRRALKNTQLKSGGVLTIAEGRYMVRQREEDEVERAKKVIEAAELRVRNARKRFFSEVAKEARRWRSIGKLDRALVYDSDHGWRLLKRF